MAFLRRLLGGREQDRDDATGAAGTGREASTPATFVEIAEEEAARDRDLLLADAARLNDDLLQRQLRYANRSWTPPAQGGTRRADDEGADEGADGG